MNTNVFDVKYSTNQIYDTILKCIYDMKIRKKCINSKNLYGGGKTGIRITKFIENLKIQNQNYIKNYLLRCYKNIIILNM